MATFNGILQFGVLNVNGVKPSPTRPWVTDSYPGNLSSRGNGNIPVYSGHPIEFYDSAISPNNKITWAYIKDGNKQLYISTKVLLTNISWNQLNEQGMIFGTSVKIDGKEYKLRVLANYDWQVIVENKFNIVGLPIPTTEDTTHVNTYGQLDGKHNELWNWWGIRTMCQETLDGTALNKGYSSVTGTSYYAVGASSKEVGWRPVLEYIESTPPEKPTIITPTGTETEPSVTDDDPVQVVTQFNNPGGEFQWMDIEVFDIDQNKNIVQNANVANTEYFIRSGLVKGNRYQIKIRHQNKSGQYSQYARAYFIYGQLNKYKLSEPITQKQYDKLKAYSKGQELIMKPQTFPETENSVVRLVPQTMNTLTAGETNTKELEFTASTKQPVVGDRLIKDKEIYTVEEPRANKVILDKPITTSAGETIKFLDYDLEVKSKDSVATITPTTITNSYYEYDAKFDKKEANRDLTIKGRNTKLTTLYYYNY